MVLLGNRIYVNLGFSKLFLRWTLAIPPSYLIEANSFLQRINAFLSSFLCWGWGIKSQPSIALYFYKNPPNVSPSHSPMAPPPFLALMAHNRDLHRTSQESSPQRHSRCSPCPSLFLSRPTCASVMGLQAISKHLACVLLHMERKLGPIIIK